MRAPPTDETQLLQKKLRLSLQITKPITLNAGSQVPVIFLTILTGNKKLRTKLTQLVPVQHALGKESKTYSHLKEDLSITDWGN